MNHNIDAKVRAEIERRLVGIEAEEGVRYLFAIESGSRAWGFPSPDSDYDIRFVYSRPKDWYLSLEPGRDVIEQPIVDDIDLNGWDIRKALKLTLKSNAVIAEWLNSPILYRPICEGGQKLRELAELTFNPRGYALHYANLGMNNAARWLGGPEDVPVKRYFYALRPALAIRSLRLDPTNIPPMDIDALSVSASLDKSVRSEIRRLVELKAQTRELANVCRLPSLDNLIADELGRADEVPERKVSGEYIDVANQTFLDIVSS